MCLKTKYDFDKKLSIFMFILGAIILLYPKIQESFNNKRNMEIIQKEMQIIQEDILQEENDIKENQEQDENYQEPVKTKYDLLYEAMQNYNKFIYEHGQNSLLDPFMFEVPSLKLSDYDIPSDIFGYISIPAMDIELPIYLGATTENMKLGATYLASTSYPIGGENTNTVICAHRGMSTQAMFRNIEKLKVGDKITITNYWEELTYEVKSFAVIYPDQVNNIFIQEGKEMLTLSTCHPYRYNYQRYIVYCERIK